MDDTIVSTRLPPISCRILTFHKVLHDEILTVFITTNLREFLFENSSTVVTQISEDPLHNCCYMCKDCQTCFHQFICSCEVHRVKRQYCRHLCAVGYDKKLRFQFETNVSNLEDCAGHCNDSNDGFGCEDGFENDQGGGENGYDTDDAPESNQILQQMQNSLPKKT